MTISIDSTHTTQTKPKPSWRSAATLFLTRNFPSARRAYWRLFYKGLDRLATGDDCVFMNYGYADEQDRAFGERVSPDYFQRKLYERVLSSIEITGRDVLEVGCGRGGGASALHAKLAPRRFVGVDLSLADATRCHSLQNRPGLEFRQGDALNLPFDAESFDVLLNIESSHCYASRERFFAETERVLRPGGYFCFSDLIWPAIDGTSTEALVSMLQASGLVIVEEQDMSANVLLSRALTAEHPGLQSSMDRWATSKLKDEHVRRESLAYPGSPVYASLEDGSASYRRWILRKRDGVTPSPTSTPAGQRTC